MHELIIRLAALYIFNFAETCQGNIFLGPLTLTSQRGRCITSDLVIRATGVPPSICSFSGSFSRESFDHRGDFVISKSMQV